MSQKSARLTIWVVLGVVAFCVLVSVMAGAAVALHRAKPNSIGVVEVIGPIQDAKKVLHQLESMREDDAIVAVIVRIDSPGGAVGPSQEIHDGVLKLKQKKKVYASMGSVAASGGYYIAAACDQIYANAGTLTGSIGVIMQMANVQGLLKTLGVEMSTITAGTKKDAGSPFRTMTPEEKAYFSTMLADVHEQFIEAVAKGRKQSIEQIRPLADGRVYSGRQAKQVGLVDGLGSLDAAAEALWGALGEKGTYELYYPPKSQSLFESVMGGDAEDALVDWLRLSGEWQGPAFRLH